MVFGKNRAGSDKRFVDKVVGSDKKRIQLPLYSLFSLIDLKLFTRVRIKSAFRHLRLQRIVIGKK